MWGVAVWRVAVWGVVVWGVPTLGKSSVSCVRWVTPGPGTKARCGRSWHCGVWSAQPGGPRHPLSGGLRGHHHRGVPLQLTTWQP